jgi:hypothetical protein
MGIVGLVVRPIDSGFAFDAMVAPGKGVRDLLIEKLNTLIPDNQGIESQDTCDKFESFIWINSSDVPLIKKALSPHLVSDRSKIRGNQPNYKFVINCKINLENDVCIPGKLAAYHHDSMPEHIDKLELKVGHSGDFQPIKNVKTKCAGWMIHLADSLGLKKPDIKKKYFLYSKERHWKGEPIDIRFGKNMKLAWFRLKQGPVSVPAFNAYCKLCHEDIDFNRSKLVFRELNKLGIAHTAKKRFLTFKESPLF